MPLFFWYFLSSVLAANSISQMRDRTGPLRFYHLMRGLPSYGKTGNSEILDFFSIFFLVRGTWVSLVPGVDTMAEAYDLLELN